MGCAKCNQSKEFENNKETEIVYNQIYSQQQLNSKPNKNFILETFNNQINTETSNRNEMSLVEAQKLSEMIEVIKLDKNKIRIIKKFQSHIRGIQLRRKLRIENLKKSEAINFNELMDKKLPLSKCEMVQFFDEYPPKIEDNALKLDKKDPLILDNHIIYYGEWDMNFFTKHGRGIQIWPDGSFYKGYWKNNKAEGKGEFIHSTGDVYFGNWYNNKRHGKGMYHSKMGMEYNGYWKNDKQDGKGKEVWEDGSTYTGYYVNGKKNGKGKMEWSSGCQYIGNFENGNINGKGVYTFADDRVYEGDFVNNLFEGKGTLTWPNGNKYVGHFKNDKRDGFGIFTFADGKVYKGVWKNGKQDGEFEIYKPKKGLWYKKKLNDYEEEQKDNNNNKIIDEEEEEKKYDKEENKIIEGTEIEKIDIIQKTEENKIELDEEF